MNEKKAKHMWFNEKEKSIKNKIRDFERFTKEDLSALQKSFTSEELELFGENIVSSYELPLRIAVNFKINNEEKLVPMVTEESSVVAGVCYGAKLCNKKGIKTRVINEKEKIPKAKAELIIDYSKETANKIIKNKKKLLKKANKEHSYSKAYDLVLKKKENTLIISILIDSGEAMGAAVASNMSETISGEIEKMTGKEPIGNVISNASGRLVEAETIINFEELTRHNGRKTISGEEVAEKIIKLSKWAERDPERAVTHNKGIMNGVEAVAIATGQDTRAIEAACYYLAREKPLSRWEKTKEGLKGRIKLLIPCGVVGGELKKFPKALLGLKIMKVRTADELAEVMAGVGLAQNLAALSMLATIGVTRGHGEHRK